ncbi:hypothetical protein SteCoe_25240 [Stentor coeruleus]|uniref:Uncharacterized protein n=1 Tax=Stentor coeruleus TaxID=5963 RepID=A0A1R2BG04_9CILI|nr:hypothetical protein SteCoe_25240 [Stentor coeruleus]
MDQEKGMNANDELKKLIEENTEKILKELLEEADKNFTSDSKDLQMLIEANTEKLIQEIISGLPHTEDCKEELNDRFLKIVQENTQKILDEIVYELEANEKKFSSDNKHAEAQQQKNELQILIEKNTEDLLQELIKNFEEIIIPDQPEDKPLVYSESIQVIN